VTPAEIGAIIQTFGPIFTLIGLAVTGAYMVRAERERRRARQDVTPESVNETTRIGNEFLTGLLKDAREERKELRDTIRQLTEDGTTKDSVIQTLRALDQRKTDQIAVLERRAEMAAAKLRAGIPLTLADILGPGAELEQELGLGDVEDTVTTH
jgi:hypothetical protein